MNDATRRSLYQHVGCYSMDWATTFGGCPPDQVYGAQAKVDKIVDYYDKHRVFVTSEKEMLQHIRQEWTAGLGPVASWLLWMGIKTLAKKVVLWLWKNYTS